MSEFGSQFGGDFHDIKLNLKLKTICSPSKYHIDDNFEEADFICDDFTKDKLPPELRQLIYT